MLLLDIEITFGILGEEDKTEHDRRANRQKAGVAQCVRQLHFKVEGWWFKSHRGKKLPF